MRKRPDSGSTGKSSPSHSAARFFHALDRAIARARMVQVAMRSDAVDAEAGTGIDLSLGEAHADLLGVKQAIETAAPALSVAQP